MGLVTQRVCFFLPERKQPLEIRRKWLGQKVVDLVYGEQKRFPPKNNKEEAKKL
jgi:hypothetical protein